MRRIILPLILVCHVLTIANGNPVKKAGVVYEALVESLSPELTELNGSDEATIVLNLDSSESDYKEIPLAFLANSPSGEDEDDTSSEDASVSVEAPKIKEPIKPTVSESLSDETGTCVDTTPQAYDSDENGTCLPTTETTDDSEESDEIRKIVIKKTIITPGESSSSSSEEVDMIITPFLPVSDIAEIIKPKVEEEDEKMGSEELSYNLIDSNDILKRSDDLQKTVRQEEQSILHRKFSSFIDALMGSFLFGA